jgi:hypothetical protein
MTSHERYFETLAVGGTIENAEAERDKTKLDILKDYKGYPDFEMVLNIWTEGR